MHVSKRCGTAGFPSGLGQLRVKLGHCSDVHCTTALPPKADVHPPSCYVANVPLATLVHCGRTAGGLAVAFPSHVTLVISIINREVPSCELPASCLWSSRCWLSPVLLRPSRATSPTSAG